MVIGSVNVNVVGPTSGATAPVDDSKSTVGFNEGMAGGATREDDFDRSAVPIQSSNEAGEANQESAQGVTGGRPA
jgi:hypothetical protein